MYVSGLAQTEGPFSSHHLEGGWKESGRYRGHSGWSPTLGTAVLVFIVFPQRHGCIEGLLIPCAPLWVSLLPQSQTAALPKKHRQHGLCFSKLQRGNPQRMDPEPGNCWVASDPPPPGAAQAQESWQNCVQTDILCRMIPGHFLFLLI